MEQLSLPFEQTAGPGEGEPRQQTVPQVDQKRARKRRHGFVPVTRDPDVARSYSDSAALDSAIAQGLAHILTALPPEELAALRARVTQAARQNGKASRSE